MNESKLQDVEPIEETIVGGEETPFSSSPEPVNQAGDEPGQAEASGYSSIDREEVKDSPATGETASDTVESPGASLGRMGTVQGQALKNFQALSSIPVTLTLNVGSKEMLVCEILELKPGAIIQFDRRESEPLDICVNGTLIAKGEVVLLGESYGLRVLEIL